MRMQAFLLVSNIALATLPGFATPADKPADQTTPAGSGSTGHAAASSAPANATAGDEALQQNRPASKKERIRYTIPPARTKRM